MKLDRKAKLGLAIAATVAAVAGGKSLNRPTTETTTVTGERIAGSEEARRKRAEEKRVLRAKSYAERIMQRLQGRFTDNPHKEINRISKIVDRYHGLHIQFIDLRASIFRLPQDSPEWKKLRSKIEADSPDDETGVQRHMAIQDAIRLIERIEGIIASIDERTPEKDVRDYLARYNIQTVGEIEGATKLLRLFLHTEQEIRDAAIVHEWLNREEDSGVLDPDTIPPLDEGERIKNSDIVPI